MKPWFLPLLVLLCLCPHALAEAPALPSATIVRGQAERPADASAPDWSTQALLEAPSLDARPVAKLFAGTEVVVLGVEDGWAQVTAGDGMLSGYAQTECFEFNAAIQASCPTVSVVMPGGKALRYVTDTDAVPVGRLETGMRTQVAAILPEDWLLVRAGSVYAFMRNGGVAPALPFDSPGEEENAEPLATPAAAGYAGVIKSTPLRAQSGERIATLERGSLVTVLQFGSQTSLVSTGAQQGHVDSHDLNYGCGEWSLPLQGSVAVVCGQEPGNRLNLRAHPSREAPSLGQYYNGTRVTKNTQAGDEWISVSVGELRGYMLAYLLADEGTPAFESTVSSMPIQRVHNPSSYVHLRKQPSTASTSLGIYSDGTLVTVCGITDKWAHVLVGGQMGFMLRKFLTK